MEFISTISSWNPIIVILAIIGLLIAKSMIPFFPLPKEPLMLFSGLYFGLLIGSIVNIIGLVVGCLINFELAYSSHESLANKMSKLTELKEKLQEKGWRVLVPLRILPITPQDITSYASGLSRIPRRQYYWISAIPFTFYGILFAYFGEFSISWIH